MESTAEYAMYMTAIPEQSAADLARALVEQQAAACVQTTTPVQSCFYWEGAIQHETECLLFIKTVRCKREEVERVLVEHHPYQVPELTELPLTGGSQAYLRWIDEVVLGHRNQSR